MARGPGIPASHALDQRSLQHWFGTQPREVALTLSCRAGLRVLPLLGSLWGRPNFQMLPFFRAAQSAWTYAQYPGLAARALGRASLETLSENSFAGAALMLAEAAPLPTARNNTSEFASRAIASAIHDESVADPSLEEVMAVEAAGDFSARRAFAVELAASPLWQEVPHHIDVFWKELRAALSMATDADWKVWTDWYEDRLVGRLSFGKPFDIAVATLPNSLWEQGPSVVNTRIKELIAEHSPLASLQEESLPAQTLRAAVFRPNAAGMIDVALPTRADRLADTAEVHDFYGETREKLDELISLGKNMLGARLDRTSRGLQSRMPETISEAVERLVWSSGNTLRSILAGHDAVAQDRDPHHDKLDLSVVGRLRDVVDTFNQLAIADPALRSRDAGRPGPQEHSRTLAEIESVKDAVGHAANDRNITTEQAAEQLAETVDIVNEASASLTDRLAVELARDTDRNFVAVMVVAVYRTLRRLPSLARGEGGFISKEFFSGVYKYAGGAAVAGAIAGGYYIRWEIIEFIACNADQFRLTRHTHSNSHRALSK
jgi:hypothetical protein